MIGGNDEVDTANSMAKFFEMIGIDGVRCFTSVLGRALVLTLILVLLAKSTDEWYRD